MNSIRQLLGVPWVDDKTAVQALCSTSELRQDHDTVSLLLCRDVLVGHQVHTVACRRHETDIRDSVERNKLVERDRLVHEVDGHELDSAELAVDASYELIDDSTEVLVLLDVLSRRNGDLYKHDLTDPFGMLCEEHLESVQLLWYTLDVVEAINTNDELHTLELLLEGCYPLLYLGLLETLVELLGIDTDGESADSNDLALELDSVWCCGKSPGPS